MLSKYSGLLLLFSYKLFFRFWYFIYKIENSWEKMVLYKKLVLQ